MHQRLVFCSAFLFPGGARHKRRRLSLCLLGLCLLGLCLLGLCLLGLCLRLVSGRAEAQTPGQSAASPLIVSRAARVDIGHTGIHTHANSITFDLGGRDLAAMQANPARFPRLTLRAHSRLPTDRAALPPGLAMPGDPPLDNPYGPMDGGQGKPGWSVTLVRRAGRQEAKVVVPTRFANWVALQPPARRKAYLDPRRYWLEVRWGG